MNAKSLIDGLAQSCNTTLAQSLSTPNDVLVGQSHVLASDLQTWCAVLAAQPEVKLLETASGEYVLSLLNACQGQYRNAFKGLRLVLELCLQSTYLSTNLVLRQEWMKGESDTIWAVLIDTENGPLSKRYCRAFFPDLCEHCANFREIAKSIYRELSECIHGNVPSRVPLPDSLVFNADAFLLWHEKAKVVRQVIAFALSTRYLCSLPEAARTSVEPCVSDQLGHIKEVRSVFGGVVGE